MSTESAQLQRVRQARGALLRTHPFFGVLALKLSIRETDEIPTAGVNNTTMAFNPAFIDTMTQGELKGLIAHEVLHLAMQHHARENGRNHDRWNRACDFAINPLLERDGFTLPEGGCIDPQYAGMSAEAIYEKLPPDDPNAPQQPKWGTFDSAGPEDSADAKEAQRVWAENAADAAKAAKSAGKLPAHLEREIGEALAPKADWKALTRRWLADQVRVTTTWSRPNKRFPGIYLPGKVKDGLGPLGIFIDTSGSIDAATLDRFGAGVREIVADLEPAAVHVIYCDADVNHVDSFEAGEEITLHAHGGGGTDFRPPFERVATEGWALAGVIYLTDLMGRFPETAPAYPVLWAAHGAGGAVAPLGETVVIE